MRRLSCGDLLTVFVSSSLMCLALKLVIILLLFLYFFTTILHLQNLAVEGFDFAKETCSG